MSLGMKMLPMDIFSGVISCLLCQIALASSAASAILNCESVGNEILLDQLIVSCDVYEVIRCESANLSTSPILLFLPFNSPNYCAPNYCRSTCSLQRRSLWRETSRTRAMRLHVHIVHLLLCVEWIFLMMDTAVWCNKRQEYHWRCDCKKKLS